MNLDIFLRVGFLQLFFFFFGKGGGGGDGGPLGSFWEDLHF